MRTLLVIALGLSAGCFADRGDVATSEQQQPTPAEKARDELAEAHRSMRALSAEQRAVLTSAGPILAASDPTTRAAVSVAFELHKSFQEDPDLRVEGAFAATAPSVAARVRLLRAALSEHDRLLRQLHVSPLPEAPDLDALEPPAEFTDAAVRVEEAMGGRWPLKRVFIAYALELELIRDEAKALVQCGDACPAGTAERATALQRAAARLAERLEEFAALYC